MVAHSVMWVIEVNMRLGDNAQVSAVGTVFFDVSPSVFGWSFSAVVGLTEQRN